MSTGFRKIQQNTRERALSSDINALQTFHEQDLAEWFRAFVDSSFVRDSVGVTEAENSTLTSPVKAAIFQGLLVEPQAGSNDIQVRAGLACFINPDAAPDESNYKFMRDAGVRVNGILSIAPNPGIAAVVSVIECRVNAVSATTIQNRDIFDPTTGLFTPTPVTKQVKGQLEYQVRSGGVGGGFPGTAAGWLPLAVVVAPAGSLTNDNCEFWDVRPMLQDRLNGPMNVQDTEAHVVLDGSFADNQTFLTASGNPELSGVILANYNGSIAGGTLKTTVAGVDANYIHTGAAGPNSDGLNPPANFQVNTSVFACFPFGLPRWCRYNRTPLARTPGPFNGIPIVASRPAGPRGEIQAGFPVRLNASFGFGAAVDVATGVALVTAPCPNAAANMTTFSLRNRRVVWSDLTAWNIGATSSTPTSHTFTLTENANFPRNIGKFGHFDAAEFTAFIPSPILISRSAVFLPNFYNIEDDMTLWEWCTSMPALQPNPQTTRRIYWQSIPVVHPDAGPVVHSYSRSYVSLSPGPGFTLVFFAPLVILGWEMR